MVVLSYIEEDYLKAIYKVFERTGNAVSTNAIAKFMDTSPASVTDMFKRLNEKELIQYEKYKGVSLRQNGTSLATRLVRKHRLWEVFLLEKLGFTWDEVHEVAEQLEHIQSEKLVERLDEFLGYPKYDPHGDPIPDNQGKFILRSRSPLSDVALGDKAVIVGVLNHTSSFLQYLDSIKLALGEELAVLEKFEFDASIKIRTLDSRELIISNLVAKNILVKPLK